jgi:hypothetical protein
VSKIVRAPIVVTSIATLVCACSFTGFDGYVGPPKDDDSNSAEGGVDGGRGDSGGGDDGDADSSTDAGVDAGSPHDPPVFGATDTWCTKQLGLSFCDDFDTTTLKTWTPQGNLSWQTTYGPRSAPNNFVVAAPANSGTVNFTSKITKELDPSTNMEVAFDFLPEQVSPTAFFMLGAVEYLGNADAKYSMRLVYFEGSVRLEESDVNDFGGPTDRLHALFTVPEKQWSRVKLSINLNGGSPSIAITLDGTSVGGTIVPTPTAGYDTTKPVLLLGAVNAGSPHTGWVLHYDNVTVTYR